jgi:hypothetical protein
MRHELEITLRDVVNELRLRHLLEAYDLLNEIGLSSHDSELQNIFGLQDGVSDNALYVDRVETVLILALGMVAQQYSVTLREDTPLDLMTKLIKALALFERYIQTEFFEGILTSDELDDIEKVAELIPLVAVEIDYQDILDYVTEVKPTVIARMLEITRENALMVEEEEVEVQSKRYRTQLINRLQGLFEAPLLIYRLAKSGYQLGTPLHQLVEPVLDELGDISQEGPDRYVGELLGLYLYSNTPVDGLELTRKLYEDLNEFDALFSRKGKEEVDTLMDALGITVDE